MRFDSSRSAERHAGARQPGRPARRLALVLCVALSLVLPCAARAAAPKPGFQVAGFFRMQVGDFEVTSLFDGPISIPPSWLKSDAEQVSELIAQDFPSRPPNFDGTVAGFLVNTGSRLILVDAGIGQTSSFPGLGRLMGNLRASGYRPEQVDLVLITHMHFDHIGGLLTREGRRAFPNAVVRMAVAESDYWLSPLEAAKAPKESQASFQKARQAAAPYLAAGRWKPFSGTDELAPGVRPYPLVGHTPGHSGYEFVSRGQRLLAWGDTVHVAPVQFGHPDVGFGFDVDSQQAIDQRLRLFAQLADDQAVVAGAHLGFPSLGRLRVRNGEYSWVPVRYAVP